MRLPLIKARLGGRRRTRKSARAPDLGLASGAELALEPLDDLDGARGEWAQLALSSENVFATWEWASIWWRHFGAGNELATWAGRDDSGKLRTILPLYRSRGRPIRTMRFLGHGPGDRLGPVCAPADRDVAASALRHALNDRRDWDIFLGETLPGEHAWGATLGAPCLRREDSPTLRSEGRTWDEFVASRSANFREQLRRRERKLAREHELRYRLTSGPADLDGDLDILFALHRARWNPDGSEPTAFVRHEAFHREFAASALERGWLRLWVMELDGRAVAAWYGFRYGGAEWYYQAGRAPSGERQSVGFVLLAHTLRETFNDGLREYKLLRGREPYKARFAENDCGLETIALARGARGQAALASIRVARSMPAVGRRALRTLASAGGARARPG